MFDAHVIGLEHIEALYQMSCKNFKVSKFLYLVSLRLVQNDATDEQNIVNRVEIHHCDGRLGWPANSENELYDVIHVGAAAPEVPSAFFKQLKKGGRLILPGKRKLQE